MINRFILMLASVFALMAFRQANNKTYSLTVEAREFRNSTGIIQFTLYNKDGSIPDEHFTRYYKMQKGEITNNRAQVTFKDLPAGNYAVNVLHDENRNGKVDKGFFLPKEGLGFSNYESLGLTNRPNYAKASFNLQTDMTIRVKIIYLGN